MKVNLELNFVGDGRVFLNRWDYIRGNDVVAQVNDGKLYMWNEGEGEREISLNEFIDHVKQSME